MSLDALLTELVTAEAALADAALAAHDPVAAWLEASGRHEQIVVATQALVGEPVACRKGCGWCCHFRVTATASEVLALAAWMRANLPAERVAAALDTARRNARQLATLDAADRLRVNLPCPSLRDGACDGHPARPSRCRTYHARDVEGCRAAYDRPDEPGASHALVPALHTVARTLAAGFREAVVRAGFDDRLYELNGALAEALAGDGALRRYLRKERAFVDALVFAEPLTPATLARG